MDEVHCPMCSSAQDGLRPKVRSKIIFSQSLVTLDLQKISSTGSSGPDIY